MPQLIVSTHFDDAVLSVAHVLQHATRAATVVTVCGGAPPPEMAVSSWDRGTGFSSGWEAGRARAHEDRRACAITGAQPNPLAYLDSPYSDPVCDSSLLEEIGQLLLTLPRAVLWLPAGIDNADHVCVRDVLLPLAKSLPAGHLRVYADLPYAGPPGKGRLPEELESELPGLIEHEVVIEGEAFDRKLQAFKCHASQVEPLRAHEPWSDLLEPDGPLARERFWSR